MKRCKQCLQPDTRPGIKFDEDGLCPACHYFSKVHPYVNWLERDKELKELLKNAKNDSGYDCVLGVSGGKDSTRLALY